jgi:hypothetical protein
MPSIGSTADAKKLLERADAARKLILDEPGIDRLLLLAAVVWPELATDEPESARTRARRPLAA